jgi:hypothetical protein
MACRAADSDNRNLAAVYKAKFEVFADAERR